MLAEHTGIIVFGETASFETSFHSWMKDWEERQSWEIWSLFYKEMRHLWLFRKIPKNRQLSIFNRIRGNSFQDTIMDFHLRNWTFPSHPLLIPHPLNRKTQLNVHSLTFNGNIDIHKIEKCCGQYKKNSYKLLWLI